MQNREALCVPALGRDQKKKTWDVRLGGFSCTGGFKLCTAVELNPYPIEPPAAPAPPAAPQGPAQPPQSPGQVQTPSQDKKSVTKCTKKKDKGKCEKNNVGGPKGRCALTCGTAVCVEETQG